MGDRKGVAEPSWLHTLQPGDTVLLEVELLTHPMRDVTQVSVAGIVSGGKLVQTFWVPTPKLRPRRAVP